MAPKTTIGSLTNMDKKTKQCPVCKKYFPRSHFKEKGGRASYCEKCWRDYCRVRQRAYRERLFNKRVGA